MPETSRNRFFIRITPQDRAKIMKRMEEAGIRNISAYIRKMAIDGFIIALDLSDVKEAVRLLRINSNNINQIAKKANETGNIYLEDIKFLQKQQNDIWKTMKEILLSLSKIK